MGSWQRLCSHGLGHGHGNYLTVLIYAQQIRDKRFSTRNSLSLPLSLPLSTYIAYMADPEVQRMTNSLVVVFVLLFIVASAARGWLCEHPGNTLI